MTLRIGTSTCQAEHAYDDKYECSYHEYRPTNPRDLCSSESPHHALIPCAMNPSLYHFRLGTLDVRISSSKHDILDRAIEQLEDVSCTARREEED
jgi:hypothetical protein